MMTYPRKKHRTTFEKIKDDLMPNNPRLIGQQEVLDLCAKEGVKISLRTLQLYIKKGIIRKGIKIHKEVFHDKGYIVKELIAVHILKTTLGRSIKEIEELAAYPKAHLYKLVEEIHNIVSYLYENNPSMKKSKLVIEEYGAEKMYKQAIDKYLKYILKGGDYEVEDISKFIGG